MKISLAWAVEKVKINKNSNVDKSGLAVACFLFCTRHPCNTELSSRYGTEKKGKKTQM